jgi:hypothetical protein
MIALALLAAVPDPETPLDLLRYIDRSIQSSVTSSYHTETRHGADASAIVVGYKKHNGWMMYYRITVEPLGVIRPSELPENHYCADEDWRNGACAD